MLILLPPSEKKVQPRVGPIFELDELCFSKELGKVRRSLLRNQKEVTKLPTDIAVNVYSGVLYQAFQWETLESKSQELGNSCVLISSALFGLLSPNDLIPAYKLKIQPSLWKIPIAKALKSYESELIIDCRSSSYAATWSPPRENTILVKVFEERSGEKTVITHMAKKTRGEVARLLLMAGRDLMSFDDLQDLVAKNYRCELVAPTKVHGWQLEIIAN